ncbi:hypothetical protein LJ707_12670 [Mucilaginibacter sp. UR6-1]|uniref:hypothetical protein n=1 Tax=Mucilaginibacter sp. UR6-1 TaxID=1435643 RepID=UPI001E4389F9|nr:hypothetical protein [Mucilaginibacter sp. UR6-1]MCC8409785.1 hypothetical protein [Mucilaginibacter sp. UR6-1]
MQKIILITLTTLFINTAFGQNNSYIKSGSIGKTPQEKPAQKEDKFLYGPVKYRELSETVGEKYVVVPLMKRFAADGYTYLSTGTVFDRDKKVLETEGEGKILILKSLDNEYAHFKDSVGMDYTSQLFEGSIKDIVPVYDIDQARKLFLGKTLWLNQDQIYTFDQEKQSYTPIKNLRFEPVLVTDIVISYLSSVPARFIVKTKNGEVGLTDVLVSGTNSAPEFLFTRRFTNIFFTKDPKLTYKFTPAMWAKIKAGVTEIGMTEDQVKLSRGFPDKINRSTGAGTADQWIYGESYLYFRNGKLTSIQN